MKQEIIEEMARIIAFDLCPNRSVHARWGEEAQCYSDNNFAECTKIKNVVDKLYNAGYRKIPENAVVLTREEYEKLKQYEEKVKSGACFTQKEWLELCDEECKRNTENLSKARQLERKETAWKFAERLKAMAYQSTDWSHGEHPMVVEVDYIDEICEEITDKGVQNGN